MSFSSRKSSNVPSFKIVSTKSSSLIPCLDSSGVYQKSAPCLSMNLALLRESSEGTMASDAMVRSAPVGYAAEYLNRSSWLSDDVPII